MTRNQVHEQTVFLNGEFLPAPEARISVFDHAILYGDGVFDTCFAWNGRIFKLEQHLDRLFRSVAYVNIEPAYSRLELRELILDTVRRNGLENAYIKCILTRGTTEHPLLDPTGARSGTIIFALPYLSLVSNDASTKGVRVKTPSVRRVPIEAIDPRVKSLNYLNIVLGLSEARAAGADTSIMLDAHGNVAEGAGFNVFCAKGNGLVTPRANRVLEGITRETVLELAREAGMDPTEQDTSLYDLYVADEVFLSSTAGGIVPVVEIDGRQIGEGKPGPVFEEINRLYLELIESDRYGTAIYT